MKPLADVDAYTSLDIRTGTVLDADLFERARVPAYRLRIDFGEDVGILASSAQLTVRYQVGELKGRRVVAVINFPAKNIAGFESQCLVLGAVGRDGDVALLSVDEPIENGSIIS